MPATTEYHAASSFGHDACLLCGRDNPWSLGLVFSPDGPDGVQATFAADPRLQGYDGLLHGGVAAAVLDAAMTHCLFRQGIRAVTGDLRIRYPHPVPVGGSFAVQARLAQAHPPLYRLTAELRDGDHTLVRAQATFCRVADTARPTKTSS